MKLTGLSFIISHREDDSIEENISAIKNSVPADLPFEIISAVGNHPTVQRNEATKQAQFSHIYFLDDDAIVNKHSIETLIEVLSQDLWNEKKISIIGGPALLKKPANYFEECIDALFASRTVVGKIRSRYHQVGHARLSNDQEMILCNLIIVKEHFIQLEKFDARLYPNEENDLIYRLLFQSEDREANFDLGKVLYHPQIYIHRPQRKSYVAFIKQMFNYGRGRAEQTKNNFKTLHFHLLLAIPFFLLIILAIISTFYMEYIGKITLNSPFLKENFFIILKNFLSGYFLYTFYVFAKQSVRFKKIFLHIPPLIFICHSIYGMGLLLGFFSSGFKSEKKKIYYRINKLFKTASV